MTSKKEQICDVLGKTKLGLASAITLGAAAVTSGVSADEVTTNNPATNLTADQGGVTEANMNQELSAGSQTGDMVYDVPSPALDQAVADANAAGVNVSNGNTVQHNDLASAEADLNKQQAQVEEKTAEAKANTEAINDANKKNAEIDAQNKAEADRVAKENADAKAAVDAANKAAQDKYNSDKAAYDKEQADYNKAKSDYDSAKATYDSNKSSYDANKAAYDSAKAKYDTDKAAYDRALAEYEKAKAEYDANGGASSENSKAFDAAVAGATAHSSVPVGANGYTASGSTYHIKPDGGAAMSLGGVEIISSGDLRNPRIYYRGNISESKIIKSITWGNVAPTGAGIVQKGLDGWSVGNEYNYNKNGSTSQLWLGKSGEWFRIPGAIETLDGKKHDALVKVTVFGDGLHSDTSKFALWNQDGAINTLDGYRLLANGPAANPESDGTRVQIRVADDENGDYAWAAMMYDVDGGQYIRSNGDASYIMAVGGGVNTKGDSDEELGFSYGKNMDDNALNGRASSPDGSILTYSWSNEYDLTLRNSPGGNGSAVARADFGADSQIEHVIIRPQNPPTPPTPPTEPTPPGNEPTPPTPPNVPNGKEPTPPTPQTFTPKEAPVVPHVPVPEKKNLSVNVHKVQVEQKPGNHKDVTNTEAVDINGKLVAKGSIVKWPLSNDALKAGRDYTVDYVITDALPKGYILDLEATASEAKDFDVKYDEASHVVTFTAKNSLLSYFNGNLEETVRVPVVTLVGQVVNDAATYKNTFETLIKSADKIKVENGKPVPDGNTPPTEYKVVSNTPVVYTPGSEYRTENGNVVVRYFEEGTNIKIAGDQVDVEDGEVGTTYDTKDQKQTTIGYNGKTYRITSKVVGSETGKVVNGTIYVDYFYKEVPSSPDKGNVIIHYVNEDGQTISNDVEDTPESPVGTDYTTLDNKPDKITTEDGVEYVLVPDKTEGNENGKVTPGTTEVTYVYKRVTPKPNTPTPHDNLIQPVKDILNKDGQSVNGKQLLSNSEVTYTYKWDFDQYKGMVLTKADINKGWGLVGDLSDGTVSLNFDKGSIKTIDGKDVTSEFELKRFESLKDGDDAILEIVKKSGIEPEGDFYVWAPKDVEKFVKTYVEAGVSLLVTVPVTIGDYTGEFTNKVWQIDAGNGYFGNIVQNDIPKLEALKDVVRSIGSMESLNNGVIALGQEFPYFLDGPAIKGSIEGGLKEYKFTDDFDEKYDEYNGEFYAFADQDILLKNGTVIKKGDEITKYFVQNIERNSEGKAISVEYVADPEFLAMISEDGVFDPSIFMVVKRIAYGENIENTLKVTVNGFEVLSNKVVTHTPKPEPTPEPQAPNPVAPKPERVLPNTGTDSNVAVSALGGLMATAGLAAMAGRRKKG